MVVMVVLMLIMLRGADDADDARERASGLGSAGVVICCGRGGTERRNTGKAVDLLRT